MWAVWFTAAMAQMPPEGHAELVRSLSMRHAVPCDDLGAGSPTPAVALLYVVDNVAMPPWAPMRAAQCLVDNHAAEATEALQDWVTTPELRGLGRLVLGQLDALPVAIAVPVARAALRGSDPALARQRVGASGVSEVRSLMVTE